MNAALTGHAPQTPTIIVMGVSGCGKSTVAALMASKLGAKFLDADDLHPKANIDQMAAGTPLTDAQREPWLRRVRDVAKEHGQTNEHTGRMLVIACSALKKQYREILNEAPSVQYVFLSGSKELIKSRLRLRHGHFMPESLLDSQIAALESPLGEPHVIQVDVDATPDEPHVVQVDVDATPDKIANEAIRLLRQIDCIA